MALAAGAMAQSITPVSRNGSNVVTSGPLGGPGVVHAFTSPGATDDSIAVDEAGPPITAADSSLVTSIGSSGISIVVSGSVMRGATIGPVAAVADARDNWEFTLDAPACFVLDVSMATTGTNGVVAGQGYTFVAVSGGANILLDPGSSPEALAGGLSLAGSFTRAATGRLLPGRYSINMVGRADCNNMFPYSGSYGHSISVALGPAADFDGNGQVDLSDLLTLLAHYGITAGAPRADGDADGDGDVDLNDLLVLLGAFETSCP